LPDVLRLLTEDPFREQVLTQVGTPAGLGNVWGAYDRMSVGARENLAAPLTSRLRGLFSRRFARDLLTPNTSTFDLGQVLDGGILLARLPKGELGEDTTRLVGSLLVGSLWAHTTRRATRPPEQRLDASVVIDECHNFLNLPTGVADALAESRGYRVSWVLAHQSLPQLAEPVRDALDANARNKIVFTVSPRDAVVLARHMRPFFDEYDLANRPAFHMSVRTVHQGRNQPPYTLAALPADPAIPGRAAVLRQAARQRTGLSYTDRHRHQQRHRLPPVLRRPPTAGPPPAPPGPGRGAARWARPAPAPGETSGERSVGVSASMPVSVPVSGWVLDGHTETDTPEPGNPQVNPGGGPR
jgi:hypothetical protein